MISRYIGKSWAALLFVGACTITPGHKAVGDEPARQSLLFARGCCAATAGTGNKIITHQSKTHVGWLDSTEKGFFDIDALA